jgi:hypothetical protein
LTPDPKFDRRPERNLGTCGGKVAERGSDLENERNVPMSALLGSLPILVLAALVLAGIAVSSTAAGALVTMRRHLAGAPAEDDADPVHAMGLIHWMMFAGWVAAGWAVFGAAGAALLTGIGLLLPTAPAVVETARRLVGRRGIAAVGRASLAVEAAVTMAALAVYAVTIA